MKKSMRIQENVLITLGRVCTCGLILTLFVGCELAYEPAFNGGAPGAPGTISHQQFIYREKVAAPYTEEDLTKTISLCKLLTIALYNNPNTRVSWNAARAAAFGYHASLSEYYPAIDYQGNIQDQVSNGAADISGLGGAVFPTNTSGQTTDSSTSSSTTSGTTTQNLITVFNQFTLSYLLLDFGGRDAQAELAFQALVTANWQHNLTMQQVMLSVINAYTSYIGNQALVKASEQDLEDAKIALEAAVKMRANGLATMTDVLSAQSTVEQMRLNLEQARGAEKTAFAELLINLGLPPESPLCVEGLPDKLPVIEISGDVCSLIELAKERRADIGAAIALVKEQEAQLIMSYSAGMPTFTVNGSANRVNFLKPNRPMKYNNSIALNWNCPLFNGFYYVNQEKQFKAQIAQAIANVDVTVSQVVTNVVVNYYALKTAEAALPATEALVEFSERAYKGTLSKYKVGAGSILDALALLTTLSNARAQKIAARTQWASSLANLAFSVGVLAEDSGTWMSKPPKNLSKIQLKETQVCP
jgi:outer membrane protein TolC